MKTIFAKHAKKFTSLKDEKTKGVHFDGEGNAFLTDSVKLLQFKKFEDSGDARVETLGGRKLEVSEINFKRLIPEGTRSLTGIDLKELEKALNAAVALSKMNKNRDPVIQIGEELGKFVLTFKDPELDVSMRWEFGNCDLEGYGQHFNPVLLIDCVKVVKDSKETFTFEVSEGSAFRPAYFETPSLIALILPVRVH